MNHKIRWGIYIALGLCLAGGGIYPFLADPPKSTGDASTSEKNTPRTNRPLNVNGLIIREQALTDEISTSGSLQPDEEVQLSFETSGKITHIHFKEGNPVRKGQLLAKVNDGPLLAQLDKLQSQVKLAEDRVFRQNALLLKDAISKEAYEQVKTDLATLNAEIDLVKANIRQTELRAPFDGIIGLRQVSEGAYASPTTVVATLTKVSPLKINFSVPEKYAGEMRNGTPLTFTISDKLTEYKATVYATESKVDPETRTLAVRALYPNREGIILPGQYATVKIKMREIPKALAIPTQSIVPEMGISKVFLYKNGKSMPVEVQTGLRTDALIQILQGLSPGDTLITSGTLQLRTGLPITLDHID